MYLGILKNPVYYIHIIPKVMKSKKEKGGMKKIGKMRAKYKDFREINSWKMFLNIW